MDLRFQGCKVIGYAGTDDKVKWLKELGFDFAYNYKKVNLNESVKEAALDGIDVYFDNVSFLKDSNFRDGKMISKNLWQNMAFVGWRVFSDTILSQHMKLFGRAIFLGVISGYNATNPSKGNFHVTWHIYIWYPIQKCSELSTRNLHKSSPFAISFRHTVVLPNVGKTSLHPWIPSSNCSENEVGRSFSWTDEVDTRGN